MPGRKARRAKCGAGQRSPAVYRLLLQEFIQFLNITRRSLFKDASMSSVFERLGLLESVEVDGLLWDCDELSRKITNFSPAL